MNVTHKKSLALMVAATLGSMSPVSWGIVNLDGTEATRGPVRFALEESGESSIILYSAIGTGTDTLTARVGDLSVRFPIVGGYTVDDANNKTMFVRVTLTGGAKFAKTPALVCADYSEDGAADFWDADSMSAAVVGDWLIANKVASAADALADIKAAHLYVVKTEVASVVGSTTATFNFTKGFSAAASEGCVLMFSANPGASTDAAAFVAAISVNARQDIGMIAEVGYKEANVLVYKVTSGVIAKFVTAWKAEALNASVNGTDATPTVTIDVAAASKKFENGTTVANVGAVKLNSANLFNVTVTDAMDALRISNNTADVAGGYTTINGLVTAVSIQVSGATVAGASEVSLNDAATCAGTKADGAAPTAATSGSGPTVTLKVTATDIDIFFGAGYNICLKVPGTALLQDGQLSASFTGLAGDAKYVVDLGAGGDIKKVGVNGVKVRILNIPASTNSDQAYIRFYNTGTKDALVMGTLYGQDGKVIGAENVNLFNPLKANDVEVLSAAQLALIVGGGTTPVAPWTGRAWLLVQAQISTDLFKVQSLVRAPSGVLVNVSTDAPN